MRDSTARADGRGDGVSATKNFGGSLWVICLGTFLASCSTPDFIDPAAFANHPANPTAAESPAPVPTGTLIIPSDRKNAADTVMNPTHACGMHHGGSSMGPGGGAKGHHHGMDK